MSVDSLSSVELTVLTAASASCALVMPFAAVSIWSADVLSSFDSVFTAAFAFGPPIFGGGPSVSRSSASCLLETHHRQPAEAAQRMLVQPDAPQVGGGP